MEMSAIIANLLQFNQKIHGTGIRETADKQNVDDKVEFCTRCLKAE